MDSSSDAMEPIELLVDEFLERQRRGERPTIEEYVANHPELASEIREVLPALIVIDQAAPASADLEPSTSSSQSLCRHRPDQIGDYRILREIGRGGMGVVYEAEQQSLGRRVALKVLPRQMAADGRSLARFQSEARAAARMHHTNIVPVFEVGNDEEHIFYAMQLITGQGLDQVIDELRRLREASSSGEARLDNRGEPKSESPGEQNKGNSQVPGIAQSLVSGQFRPEQLDQGGRDGFVQASAERNADQSSHVDVAETITLKSASTTSATMPGKKDLSAVESDRRVYCLSVAHVGLQTASALSHAHARGIIHRDIKPSNLLLDGAGTVWVVDFGLAKTGDGGMTHTGDLLGTIRYMSPERFRGMCDVRADLYSLGLTLYEMLMLKPAFVSSDQLKLIDQINKTEPTAPRSVDPRIPLDLETIVLKSIDKDPKGRYQSADELIDDLRRFVDDQPIRARRISLPERCRRWARHHPGVAASLSIIVVLLLTAVVASSLAANHFRQQEKVQRQLVAERQVALEQEERSRKAAEMTAYESLVGEARALRLSRLPGYRNQAWSRLKQALAIDTPVKDVDRVRLEAAACLGDFVGREPIDWSGLGSSMPGKMAVFPDSRHVALTLDQGIVSIRVIESNQEIARLETGHDGGALQISDLRVAPDGRHVVVVDSRGATEVWKRDGEAWSRVDSREALYVRLYNDPIIPRVRIFPDSRRYVVSRWADRTIKVRGLTDRSLDQSIELPIPDRLGCLSISPDGNIVAGRLNDTEIGVWSVDTADLERIATPLTHIYETAFAPDGTLVVTGTGGFVTYEAKTWSKVFLVKTDIAISPTISDDSRWMAITTPSQKIRLWNLSALREMAVFEGAEAPYYAGRHVDISPDGRWLFSPGQRGVRLWRLQELREKRTLQGHSEFVPALVFSHDGRLLATVSKDGKAKLWDVETGKMLHEFWLDKVLQSVAFSPDDRLLAIGEYSEGGSVTIWDVRTKQRLGTWAMPANRLGFTPDGRLVSARRGLHVFDVVRQPGGGGNDAAVELKLRNQLDGFSSACVSVSPDGNWAVFDKEVHFLGLYDLRNDREVRRFPDKELLLTGWHNATFLPDSRHVIFIGQNGMPQVWDTETGQLAYEIVQTRKFLSHHLALSPDGRWLAGNASNDALTIIDVSSRRELFTVGNERSPIKSVAWSPDGQRIALGLADGGVVIWDFASIRQQLTEAAFGWE